MYHEVSGSNTLAAQADGTTQTSMQGGEFSVNGTVIDDASYNNASIVLTNVQAVNGVVHGIDKVLLPEEVFQSVLSATLILLSVVMIEDIPHSCRRWKKLG